jgi:hypothetical protein
MARRLSKGTIVLMHRQAGARLTFFDFYDINRDCRDFGYHGPPQSVCNRCIRVRKDEIQRVLSYVSHLHQEASCYVAQIAIYVSHAWKVGLAADNFLSSCFHEQAEGESLFERAQQLSKPPPAASKQGNMHPGTREFLFHDFVKFSVEFIDI